MTLLILGGTGETHRIAQFCQDQKTPAIVSLSGATRNPRRLNIPTRIGGFGGRTEFASYLKNSKISRIVDATHPFAANITARSFAVATERKIPILRFERPGWQAGDGDTWIKIANEAAAAHHIPKDARVFLATGRQTLHRFENLSHAHLICRQIDEPDTPFPFPNGEYLVGRPPFSQSDETTLFRNLKIDFLVVKNAGGAASRTKLDAAKHLGIPVLMIERPKACGVETVSDLNDVFSWIGHQ